MPILETDAARVQQALDRIDHLVVAPAPSTRLQPRAARGCPARDPARRTLQRHWRGVGTALLALRRPKRPLMLALAAALAGTAVASLNDPDAGVVRIALLAMLTLVVVLSVSRSPPVSTGGARRSAVGMDRAAGPAGAESSSAWCSRLPMPAICSGCIRRSAIAPGSPRRWPRAAVFYFVQTEPAALRRAGLSVAVLATAALVVGSPWFLLHAVADPLVADMPLFLETARPGDDARHAIGERQFQHGASHTGRDALRADRRDQEPAESDDANAAPQPLRFVAGAFDGWQREIRAFDVAVIDDRRLLVLDRERGSSVLRAEELRSGRTLWTLALPDIDLSSLSAAPDGRWRAFARRGRQFERVEGRVGASPFTTTRWTVATDKQSYVDMPLNDGGSGALALASVWHEPSLTSLLTDWRETKRLFHVDGTSTTEIATSHLSVECTTPPIDVIGSVCVSFDGRSSRLWRVDLSSGGSTLLAKCATWSGDRRSRHSIGSPASSTDGRC